jgi:hypothetical protein
MTDPEAQLAELFTRYEPALARLGGALRAALRARLPGLFEVVYLYEGQGSLVIAYSPTEHGYDGLCSLALYPDGLKLFFNRGVQLAKVDPQNLLQGRGKLVRYVAIGSVADFERPELQALLTAALQLAGVRSAAKTQGALVFRVEAQQQRARKKAKAAKRAAPAKPVAARRPAGTQRKVPRKRI